MSLRIFLGLIFILNLLGPLPTVQAEEVILPKPGAMVTVSDRFSPPIITGMTIHPENPLQFDFIVDTGDNDLGGEGLKKESQKLINYFMATLAVPEDEMWVNLSPYENDRIIPEGLSNTELGRDMLVQDYILKQFTASLIYPDNPIGKEFWHKIYGKARQQFGTTEIPTNFFNKVWIVPHEATVYVNGKSVFVTHSHLKVMLEEDYFAKQKQQSLLGDRSAKAGDRELFALPVTPGEDAKWEAHPRGDGWGEDKVNSLLTGPASQNSATDLIRSIIIPEIEKEVNEGKNFANLRQIYHSMILATWYKQKLRNSLLDQYYLGKNKTNGIQLKDKRVKEKIYKQYLLAYKKGVFNFVKHDRDSQMRETIPRKYFSGGLMGVDSASIAEVKISSQWRVQQSHRNHVIVAVNPSLLNVDNLKDEAMTIKEVMDKRILEQWETLEQAKGNKEVEVHPSVADKYDTEGNARPFHGLTTGIWFTENGMLDFRDKLFAFQAKLRSLLEAQGIDYLFTYPDRRSLHLTINDLLTTRELVNRKRGDATNQRQWPPELIQLSKKFDLNPSSALPVEVRDFLVEKVNEASAEISSSGTLAFETGPIIALPGRSVSLAVFPKDLSDSSKLSSIRRIMFEKVGIKLDDFFGHITLAIQIKAMTKEQYGKYLEILRHLKEEKVGEFISQRLELRPFTDLTKFGLPLKIIDLAMNVNVRRIKEAKDPLGDIDLKDSTDNSLIATEIYGLDGKLTRKEVDFNEVLKDSWMMRKEIPELLKDDPDLYQVRNVGALRVNYHSKKELEPTKDPNPPGDVVKPRQEGDFVLAKSDMRTRLMRLNIEGASIDVLANNLPTVPFHFMLIPQIEEGLIQDIRENDILATLQLAEESGDVHLKFAHNSNRAAASLNNLHIHGFYYQEEQLPIEDAKVNVIKDFGNWKVKEVQGFPARAFLFEGDVQKIAQASRRLIELLQQQNIPYNVLIVRGKVYIMPRALEDVEIEGKFYRRGYLAMAGELTLPNKDMYDAFTEEQVEIFISQATLGEHEFNEIKSKADFAMKSAIHGGIDINGANLNLRTNDGGNFRFNLDATNLTGLRNSAGIVPVIMDIQLIKDWEGFLDARK